MPNLGIWFPKATDQAADAAGKPTAFALPYAAGLVTKAPHTDNGRKLLDFMLSAKAQQQVSETATGGYVAEVTGPSPPRHAARRPPRCAVNVNCPSGP
ncbi:hypothetical protein ACFV2U_04710 [Streptomyces sp. NPDC059697]|uniref:hypothetical protein n=1 Tax=Streptomyces sp. NPDC059697 TaxID=3346912 RepID=UPI0036B431FE